MDLIVSGALPEHSPKTGGGRGIIFWSAASASPRRIAIAFCRFLKVLHQSHWARWLKSLLLKLLSCLEDAGSWVIGFASKARGSSCLALQAR